MCKNMAEVVNDSLSRLPIEPAGPLCRLHCSMQEHPSDKFFILEWSEEIHFRFSEIHRYFLLSNLRILITEI